MSGQFEDLFQLRHTEAEQQLAEQKAQYEARMKGLIDCSTWLTMANQALIQPKKKPSKSCRTPYLASIPWLALAALHLLLYTF